MKARPFLLAPLLAAGTPAASHCVCDNAGLKTTPCSLQSGDIPRIALNRLFYLAPATMRGTVALPAANVVTGTGRSSAW